MKTARYAAIIFVFVALHVGTESTGYVVAEKDTLWSISQKYNISVQALKEANGIDDEKTLRIGMTLVIPGLYEVQKGDNLWRIAREHGTTVEIIRKLNNIRNDEIRVGDLLLLPQGENRSVTAETDSKPIALIDEPQSPEVEKGLEGVPFWPLEGARIKKTGKISGTEILGNRGDSIVSIASGEVVWNATSPVFGKVIIIESSSNYLYLYSGLANTAVEFGARINAGTKIAELGVNPHTGEAKLLFSVYKDGKLVDPALAPRG